VTCSAVEGNGVNDVWDMVERYVAHTKNNGFFEDKRTQQAKYWMFESINERLKDNFYQNQTIEDLLQHYEQRVLHNEVSSFIAAHELLETYFKIIKD
jgi:LAO/AO transport system kinase